MKTRGRKLSKRLQAVAAMVTKGNVVCDVGCDHGFVPVYLVKNGISPKVIAMDINEGPLQAAREHIGEYFLADYIETRLSDGLEALQPGEAGTVVCAGMGGRLIVRILEEGKAKLAGAGELILQPQSELQCVRAYLREQGYAIADEDMVLEDGKYYPMMRVCPGGRRGAFAGMGAADIGETDVRLVSAYAVNFGETDKRPASAYAANFGGADEKPVGAETADIRGTDERTASMGAAVFESADVIFAGTAAMDFGVASAEAARRQETWLRIEDKYGPVLLRKAHPVLREYLQREVGIYRQILAKLQENGKGQEARIQEIAAKLEDARIALAWSM